MKCPECGHFERRNVWICSTCGKDMPGGAVFVTGISGSGAGGYLKEVVKEAKEHGHSVLYHDVGEIMHGHAKDVIDPEIRWDRILDSEDTTLRLLRALAFQQLLYEVRLNPDTLHLIDLHLGFRWRAYLTKGFQPHILQRFVPYIRFFVNIIEDLAKIQERLRETSWGERKILELLIWRDEELFLTDLFAGVCGVKNYAIAAAEPRSMIEKLIWQPEIKKVYLSFPITNIVKDTKAKQEIADFRDRIREFLVVFDPWACKDYDETYVRDEMKHLRQEIGDITEERDYRFIDQAGAVVVYYPKIVASQGVDAEMSYARRTGKPIYLYKPEDGKDPSPFAVPPSHIRHDPDEYYKLLKKELSSDTKKRKDLEE